MQSHYEGKMIVDGKYRKVASIHVDGNHDIILIIDHHERIELTPFETCVCPVETRGNLRVPSCTGTVHHKDEIPNVIPKVLSFLFTPGVSALVSLTRTDNLHATLVLRELGLWDESLFEATIKAYCISTTVPPPTCTWPDPSMLDAPPMVRHPNKEAQGTPGKELAEVLKALARMIKDAGKDTNLPSPLSLSEALLFKVAMGCPELDEKTRKPPSHWPVFLAAWKERWSCYEMERKKHWPRRTAQARLTAVEETLLDGKKVADLAFDSGLLDNVERQLEAARKKGVRKMDRHALLDNTEGCADDDRD